MIRLLLLSLAALVAGCAADPLGTLAGADSPAGSLPFERLDPETYGFSPYYGGPADSLRIVVRDREAWRDLWENALQHGGAEPPPLPAVDFTRDMLVVAALGTVGSGGYSVAVERVDEVGRTLVVEVTRRTPGPSCGTIAALTSPVDIVRLRRIEAPVEFRDRTVVSNCR